MTLKLSSPLLTLKSTISPVTTEGKDKECEKEEQGDDEVDKKTWLKKSEDNCRRQKEK
jgi:hypothetical protein